MLATTNVLIQVAVDYAQQTSPALFSYLNREDFESILQNALNQAIAPQLTLSAERPDYEAILLRFMQILQEKPAWRDIAPTATGQRLLSNIASGLHTLNFAIMRATQEAFLGTAQAKSSIYEGLAQLGVPIRRRVPAQLKVRLTIREHDGAFVVPRFTQFKIGEQPYFNREQIVFSAFDLVQDVTLAQGTVYTLSGTPTGAPYEAYEVGYENYLISNTDVYVFADGTEWNNNEEYNLRPWINRATNVFFAQSTPAGNVEIRFGNGIFGKTLANTTELTLVWAETAGKDAVVVPSGISFVYDKLLYNVNGTTLSATFGGDNELDVEFYRRMGPQLRASNRTGVRRSDYKALALEYPRIVDAVFRGQAQLNPNKRSWMNIVQVTTLTDTGTPLNPAEWEDFLGYLTENSIEHLEYIRKDPVILPIKVTATLYCPPRATLSVVKSLRTARLQEKFRLRNGSIDYSVFVSDIIEVLEGGGATVDDFVEYVRELKFSYATGFNPQTLPPGVGIIDNAVIAKDLTAVVLKQIELNPQYTTRNTYLGRVDQLREY